MLHYRTLSYKAIRFANLRRISLELFSVARYYQMILESTVRVN